MQTPIPTITIDGPGGTGKGTICRLLAKQLSWHMLDSGVLYRALGYVALTQGVSLSEEAQLTELATQLALTCDSSADQQQTHVFIDKQEVSQPLRMPEVANAASHVSVYPSVRQALLARQRAFLKPPGLVTDGRDMGTVVFPDAVLKLYLDASIEVRAQRRLNQLKEQGIDASLGDLVAEISARDMRDKTRAVAPLVPAQDALCIDTSTLTIQAVMDKINTIIAEHFPSGIAHGKQ